MLDQNTLESTPLALHELVGSIDSYCKLLFLLVIKACFTS